MGGRGKHSVAVGVLICLGLLHVELLLKLSPNGVHNVSRDKAVKQGTTLREVLKIIHGERILQVLEDKIDKAEVGHVQIVEHRCLHARAIFFRVYFSNGRVWEKADEDLDGGALWGNRPPWRR